MNSIAKHISSLLYSHDCVIIPTLGGFVANYRETGIDEDLNIFTPPGKEIGFNRSLQHDDGLLTSIVSRRQKMSYETAKSLVYNYASTIKSKLNSGESYLIENVGKLKLDAMNNLQFVPANSDNFLSDAFGLTSFHFAPAEPLIREELNKTTGKNLIRMIPHKQIAASAAIIAGLFIFAPELSNNQFSGHTSQASLIPINTHNKVVVVPEKTIIEAPKTMIEESTPLIEEENKFFIIAGSFKNIQQAQAFANRLINKGESEIEIIQAGKNRFRVSVAGYAYKEEATQMLSEYRQKKGFNSVWMLSK